MPSETLRIYWDACVLLSYLNATPDRLPVIEQVLEEVRQHVWQIVTSTVSVAEVAFAAQEQGGDLDDDTLVRIDSLWTPGSAVLLHEFHFAIGDRARRLMREVRAGGRTIKPMDAIHLATARHAGAAEFQTYDEKLLRLVDVASLSGMAITTPHAAQPQLPGIT